MSNALYTGAPTRTASAPATAGYAAAAGLLARVLQAAAQGVGGEVFMLAMGEPVKIVDLARDLIQRPGLQVGRDVDPPIYKRLPMKHLVLSCQVGRRRLAAHTVLPVLLVALLAGCTFGQAPAPTPIPLLFTPPGAGPRRGGRACAPGVRRPARRSGRRAALWGPGGACYSARISSLARPAACRTSTCRAATRSSWTR